MGTEQTAQPVSAANTCERCKWWARWAADEEGFPVYGDCDCAEPAAVGMTREDFGCIFFQARESASKEEK